MESPWYRGTGEPRPGDGPPDLPTPLAERFTKAEDYLADDGLVDAVNVALHLGQPLLLTGQPGTGKTQLAYSLAHELRLGDGKPLKFETKSTSVARDLFYAYDTLGRFHAAQGAGGSVQALDFIEWTALGKAILYANAPERVHHLLDPKKHPGRRRSLVLIDEIDKAPRDFPNDLLNEVEHMYFRIPELRNEEVRADSDMRPVLVLTSNSEKNLAEAFLRRCVFYYIPFPKPDRLEQIVRRRLGTALVDKHLLASALGLFERLRDPSLGLLKAPSTAELLAWMQDLTAGPAVSGERRVERALCILIKTKDDRDKARVEIEKWVKDRSR
jgi:MoxR-like ATPase